MTATTPSKGKAAPLPHKKLYHVTADRPLHFQCVVEAATEDDAVALGRKYVDIQVESLLSQSRALNSDEFTVEAVDIEELREDTAELLEEDQE
jgi:hypothetical protein